MRKSTIALTSVIIVLGTICVVGGLKVYVDAVFRTYTLAEVRRPYPASMPAVTDAEALAFAKELIELYGLPTDPWPPTTQHAPVGQWELSESRPEYPQRWVLYRHGIESDPFIHYIARVERDGDTLHIELSHGK